MTADNIEELPVGDNPPALATPHFPTRGQAFVWRNWELATVARLAAILGTDADCVMEMARDMGLRVPPQIGGHWLQHGYVTLIRRNWHLLPYEQLLELLGWTAHKLDGVLREDDFLWIKLGVLKPHCEPVRYEPLTPEQQERTDEIRHLMGQHFPAITTSEPARPFDFLQMLQTQPEPARREWEPQQDDICLDEQWNIVLPARNERIAAFVRGFAATHRARWGVDLPITNEGAPYPRLTLSIEPDSEAPRESHVIEVTPDGIQLTANDEAGVLRGLQFLEAAMEKRGAPYLAAGTTNRRTRFDLRLIYPYCGIYGDSLIDPNLNPFPDGLLARLSKLGVNGLWLHGLLASLFPWDAAPELSEGFEQRLANLRRHVARAADFGIGIYMYMNEPRGLPLRFFDEHPELRHLKGVEYPELGVAALCTSQPEVLDFLRRSTAYLFQQVSELAGVFTITMSENPTNCYSVWSDRQCPRCHERPVAHVIAEVNAAMEAGVHSAQPEARVIAWDWGSRWPSDAIELLPPGIELMSTSEEALPTQVGGVAGSVLDYSMSQVGPGPKARGNWERARAHGLRAIAKVQVNNTWECSFVPFLPVPDLVDEHFKNLDEAGVTGLMLSWTLGGYPSPNLDLAARHYWGEEATGGANTISLDEYAVQHFGVAAGPTVRRAWACFSAAFREFPFNIGVIYHAPHLAGPMNLLHAQPTRYQATMVGLPYDDLETWRAIYPAGVFENQWRLLSEGWEHGLALLDEARAEVADTGRNALANLESKAKAAGLHFRSTHSQVAFVRRREALAAATDAVQRQQLLEEMRSILQDEIAAAKELHELVRADAEIGYEASNHYSYTLQDLREKVLNCEYLLNTL